MHVPDDQKERYRLPIALKEFMIETAKPRQLSGVMYPSIALHLIADNIAVSPDTVTSSLSVAEVHLQKVESVKSVDLGNGEFEHRIAVNLRDVARPDGDRLVWGQQSQMRGSVHERPIVVRKQTQKSSGTLRILPPDYKNCGFKGNVHTDVMTLRTGRDWTMILQ